MNKSTYDTYLKYIKPFILKYNNLDTNLLITKTINTVDNSISEKKNENMKIIEDKNELSGLCDFYSKIYIDIYHFLGYKDYKQNLWEIIIKRNIKK
jgi:hypothetical protein